MHGATIERMCAWVNGEVSWGFVIMSAMADAASKLPQTVRAPRSAAPPPHHALNKKPGQKENVIRSPNPPALGKPSSE